MLVSIFYRPKKMRPPFENAAKKKKKKGTIHNYIKTKTDAAQNNQRTLLIVGVSYKCPDDIYKHPDENYKYPDDTYKYPDDSYKHPDDSYKYPDDSHKYPAARVPSDSYRYDT